MRFCCYTSFGLSPKKPEEWMEEAIRLAVENVKAGLGGPFGALVVKDGELIASGVNRVTSTNDPTAHAEVVAIRAACQQLASFQLTGCELYTSCEPCPMCLGAIFWARPARYYYACTREDAAAAGFDDAHIYDELKLAPGERSIPGERLLSEHGVRAFMAWAESTRKIEY
jgi:guanine deaminase